MRSFSPRHVTRALACALACACALAATPAGGATGSSVVGATVLTATSIDVAGCLPGVANRTSFTPMTVGSSARTTDDCVIQYGSSNATAQLSIRQADHAGDAMHRPATGVLDAGFASGAGFTVAATGAWEEPLDMGVDAAGRTYVLYESSSDSYMLVARFGANGGLDTGWASSGISTTQLDEPSDEPADLHVFDDGSFLVAGAQSTRAAIERRTSTGAQDNGFGVNGVALTPNSGVDRLHALHVDVAGRIVVVGHNDNNTSLLLARFTAAGVLDTSFGTGGLATPDLPGSNDGGVFANSTPTGGYLFGGYYDGPYGGTNDAWIYRTSSTGAPDTGFSGDGFVDTLGIADDDWAVGAWQDDTGKVSVAMSGNTTTRLGRLVAGGASWDASFGGGGIFTLPAYYWFGSRTNAGDFVFAGTRTGPVVQAVTRYNRDGVLDTSFGTAGVATVDTQPGAGESGLFVEDGIDGDLLVAGSIPTGGLTVSSLSGVPIDDYNDGAGDDWGAANADFFAACLADASVGTTPTWAETGTCPQSDGATWNDVPPAADLIASGPASPTLHDVRLRFAVRFLSNQPAGRYVAPLEFTVVAP